MDGVGPAFNSESSGFVTGSLVTSFSVLISPSQTKLS